MAPTLLWRSVGAGLGIGGVFIISTVVALPIAVGLEIWSFGCADIPVISNVAGRRLFNKLVKHRRIEAMARAKLNTISYIVSKGLKDGNISDVEYRLVLNELQKFEDLGREARAEKASQQNIEELRKRF